MFGNYSSAMTNFSDTVRDIVEQAKLLYYISPLSTSTLICLEKNAEYLIEDKKSGFYSLLRINRPGQYTFDELTAEIKWVKELQNRNLPFTISEPIAGIDGNYVQKIVLPSDDVCYCTMFAFLRSRPIGEHTGSLLTSDFTKLGEITALMHQSALQWNGASELCRGTLDYATLIGSQAHFGLWNRNTFGSKEISPVSNELCLLFDRTSGIIKHRLMKFGKSHARFGLIHADLTVNNVMCYKNMLAVTHFNDCGFGWFLYDLASSVSFLEDKPYLSDLTAAWLEGYRRQRNISNEESGEIPTFVMVRRFELLCRLINHYDYTVPQSYTDDFIDKTAALAENYLAGFS